jgi:hypothetical protein
MIGAENVNFSLGDMQSVNNQRESKISAGPNPFENISLEQFAEWVLRQNISDDQKLKAIETAKKTPTGSLSFLKKNLMKIIT